MIRSLKHCVLLAVFGVLAVLPLSASATDMTSELKAQLQTLKKAFVDRDPATIKAIMTEDGLLVTPFFAAALTSDQVADILDVWVIESHDSHDVTVTQLDGDRGLMTLYTSFEGSFDGKPLPPWVFASAVWVKQGGTWRVDLYQETAVKAPSM